MAKRRKWIDELKHFQNDEENNKKINVLEERTYLDGKLIRETKLKGEEGYESSKYDLNSNYSGSKNSECLTYLPLTPHLKKRNIDSLTPTFRSPNSYFMETKKILKNLTPKKLAYAPKQTLEELGMSEIAHEFSASVLQSPSSRRGTSDEAFTYRAASVLQSPSSRRGTSDEAFTYRAASVPQSPSYRPGTSDEAFTYRAASVPQSPPSRPGTSDEAFTYRATSVPQSPSPRSGTSDEAFTYRAPSVPQSPSPRPGISDEAFTYRAASVPRSPSLRPGTSDEAFTYRAPSVPQSPSPRPGTSDEAFTYRAASVTQSPASRPGTSDEAFTYQAASVLRSPSPRPETSDQPVTYHAASVRRSPSLRSGTSDKAITYQAASVPRSPSPRPGTSGTNDGQPHDFPSSLQDCSLRQNFPSKKRQPKRKVKQVYSTKPMFDESYIDFAFDKEDRDTLLLNEAFPSEESDDWNGSETSDESDEKSKKNKKSMQLKNDINAEKKKPKSQIKKDNKKNKNLGKRHTNSKGTIVEEKVIKPNPCANTNCSNRCGEITEERRQSLFRHFWNLECTQRRRDWIAQITEKTCVKSCTVNDPETSRRKFTYTYYINEGEGRRKVCQKFIINTLDITQKFILYTIANKVNGFAKLDERGKNVSHNKTPSEKLEHARSVILSLPLLPSHYSRKDSQKLYLQEDIKNITNLYSIYVEQCKKDEMKPISFKVFNAYFKQNFNIGFHVPKKDKCVLCSAKTYDVLTKEQIDKMNAHLKEKEDSYNRFIFHQNLNTKDKSVICASFDLQKVLNTPHGKNMSLYYSRKISVYNFTIYESRTQEGFCYVWNETDAKRGANEIATILLKYIREVDRRGYVKTLLLYSDSCYGQNKNKTILSMLRYALVNSLNLEIIQMNYLVPGHTYMPVDSMHAVIERSLKDTMIWAPSHWPTVIALSRKNPFPYKVTLMEGRQFMGFEDILNKTFKKAQKLMISTIYVATFQKKHLNKMFVKRSMSAEAEYTEVNLSAFQTGLSPKENLYPNKLPISAQKYADLKKLTKNVIPAAYAYEYLDLKYSSKTIDCLPVTDEEDNV